MIIDRLCVIPCGKRKIWDKNPGAGPTHARDVYVGGLSGAARKYAERFYKHWVILSALHGFLLPDDLVPGTYDITFSRPGDAVISDARLKSQVKRKKLGRFTKIDIVAGKDYCETVERAFTGPRVKFRRILKGIPGNLLMASTLRRAAKAGARIIPRAV